MRDDVIVTNRLTKSFGTFTAVDRIDLRVPEGGIYGFLGPNGAGKSTTIRMLLGLVKPTEGEAILFGKPMRTHRMEILKQVGSLVEHPSYYGHLTAYENLDITRRILGVDKKEIDRVLDIVRLTDVRNKQVKKFSLGMKQRLGIAQALLGSPKLLILDEPTNGLDPAGIHEIRDLIRSLPAKLGMTVLVSSHILSEVELVASHVGIIHQGKLIFQGTLDELRAQSRREIRIVAQPAESAAALLESKGYRLEVREGGLFVKDEQADPARLNRELVLNGHDVAHVSEQRETLEERFLIMTGKGERA